MDAVSHVLFVEMGLKGNADNYYDMRNSYIDEVRQPSSKACLHHSQMVIQPCMWFMEEPRQSPVGQTAQSITCSIMRKYI